MGFLSAKSKKQAFSSWHDNAQRAKKRGEKKNATAEERETGYESQLMEGFMGKRMEGLLERDETDTAPDAYNVNNDSSILSNFESILLSMDGGKINKDVAPVLAVVKDMSSPSFIERHNLAGQSITNVTQEILNTLQKGIETSMGYINHYNPWTKAGKRRKAAVEAAYKIMSQKFILLADIYNKNPRMLMYDLSKKVSASNSTVVKEEYLDSYNSRDDVYDDLPEYTTQSEGLEDSNHYQGMNLFDLIDDAIVEMAGSQ